MTVMYPYYGDGLEGGSDEVSPLMVAIANSIAAQTKVWVLTIQSDSHYLGGLLGIYIDEETARQAAQKNCEKPLEWIKGSTYGRAFAYRPQGDYYSVEEFQVRASAE